jgi:hypothetical protein
MPVCGLSLGYVEPQLGQLVDVHVRYPNRQHSCAAAALVACGTLSFLFGGEQPRVLQRWQHPQVVQHQRERVRHRKISRLVLPVANAQTRDPVPRCVGAWRVAQPLGLHAASKKKYFSADLNHRKTRIALNRK